MKAPDRAQYLGRLVELYWRPVYQVIRHGWNRTHDDAKDLTQEFFATVVFDRELLASVTQERGSFRTLLRRVLGHFMQDVMRGVRRQKRGSGQLVLSLEAMNAEPMASFGGTAPLTPDQIFDITWTQTLMSEALDRLRARLTAEGREQAFELFRRYDVEGESVELSYDQMGEQLGMTGAKVKHALIAARAGFREIVTDLVSAYVDDPADLANELRTLFGY